MSRFIIIFIILMVSCQTNSKNIKDFNFSSYLNHIMKEGKYDLKIVEDKPQDYFKGNLALCNKDFYYGMTKNKMYYLKNNHNDIVVEEYIFDSNNSSRNAFKNVEKYANFTRKLKRSEYSSRCYDIEDEQIYYAVMKNNHIYLLTSLNNMNFRNGSISIDDILKENKEMKINDLYNDLEKLQN